ncbi:MAG: precorrin-8X methylmutase [Alphaproteobacteria bacterium]|nr:precorrin-8X methylmutase [Alphaproteobacteria bacterium]
MTGGYLQDPDAIYQASFAAIRAEADLSGVPATLHPLASRLIHACGMAEIAPDLVFNLDPLAAARRALAQGVPVIADCAMVAAGIVRRRLPAGNAVLCLLDDPRVGLLAAAGKTTRSAAQVDLWRERMAGAVIAIGNAPTALFRLIETLEAGAAPPAALFAFPVGFIGAAESKAALIERIGDVPFATLKGRRGGSPLAAAGVNAALVGEGAA